MLVSVTVTVPAPEMYIPPPCQTRKVVLAFGQFREVSSVGGVGGKFKERCAPHTEDSINCEARFDHNSSTRQFREVSSVGGVGRKCKEGSKGKHIPCSVTSSRG